MKTSQFPGITVCKNIFFRAIFFPCVFISYNDNSKKSRSQPTFLGNFDREAHTHTPTVDLLSGAILGNALKNILNPNALEMDFLGKF